MNIGAIKLLAQSTQALCYTNSLLLHLLLVSHHKSGKTDAIQVKVFFWDRNAMLKAGVGWGERGYTILAMGEKAFFHLGQLFGCAQTMMDHTFIKLLQLVQDNGEQSQTEELR